MTTEQLIEQARAENWSRRQVRDAAFKAGEDVYARRDEIFAALGMTLTGPAQPQSVPTPAVPVVDPRDAQRQAATDAGVVAAKRGQRLYITGLREDERREIGRNGWHAEGEEVWRGGSVTIAQALATAGALVQGRAARDLKAASQREQREAEVERFANVTPDWSVYRKVLALAADCAEARDAARHRDIGDWLALKGAAGELAGIANDCEVSPNSNFGQLVERVISGRATEAQAKAAAVGLAKRATVVAAQNVEAKEASEELTQTVAEELDAATGSGPVIITRPAARERERARLALRMIASKKAGAKPYLAVCGSGLAHRFVDGNKASNTSKSFAADVAAGDLIHFRGAKWSSADGAYAADEAYALILEDGVYEIDRQCAADLDSLRIDGWRADRREDAHDQGALRLVLSRDDQEASYVLRRPAVLIADAVPRDDDEASDTHSPVLECWRLRE